MRYAEFRDRLEEALQEAGLFIQNADRRVETIDLAHTARIWKVHVFGAVLPSADPFHVSAEVGFEWSPFDAARAYTTEEDLLTELVGRRRRPIRTERRWTRIDLSLHASLPYGSTASMPDSREAERGLGADLGGLALRFKTAFDEWTRSVSELATWIRYSPPPPEATPAEPWLEGESEDDDDSGPETTH